MDIAAILMGAVLLVLVGGGLTRLPLEDHRLDWVRGLGRGSRRWWVLGLAVALPLLVGVAASLSGGGPHQFALVLALGLAVPLLLACSWVVARAGTFS